MLRLIFTSIMVLHGLLHLIGFAREWNLGSQEQLSGKTLIEISGNTSKLAGALWLLTCILFLTAAVCYLLRRDWYWIPAAFALVTSQALIILYWQDAKYGTIVNVVILIAGIFSAAEMHFNNMARREVQTLLAQSKKTDQTITEDMIAPLPQNVQRWMRESDVVGKKTPNTLRVVQRGSLRTEPGGRWMPFSSLQYFTIDPPGFVWIARIKAAPLIEIGGRDKFLHGHGNMLIKPLYLFTAADGQGKEIDQGTLLRYLAEIAWFPQAAISTYLKWENIDDYHALVTMEYGTISASGVYSFNKEGLVEGFEARRYGDFGGIYRKETWSVVTTGFKTFNSIRLGHSSEATWKLKEGDFTWLKMEVTEIH